MWVSPGREYGLCSSVSLWLGQSIAFHHIGEKIQRISDSSSPITNSEEPFILYIFIEKCELSINHTSTAIPRMVEMNPGNLASFMIISITGCSLSRPMVMLIGQGVRWH